MQNGNQVCKFGCGHIFKKENLVKINEKHYEICAKTLETVERVWYNNAIEKSSNYGTESRCRHG